MTDLIIVPQTNQWHKLKAMVLDSVSSPITRRVYNLGLNEFFEWFGLEPRPGFTKATVAAWRVALEPGRFRAYHALPGSNPSGLPSVDEEWALPEKCRSGCDAHAFVKLALHCASGIVEATVRLLNGVASENSHDAKILLRGGRHT